MHMAATLFYGQSFLGKEKPTPPSGTIRQRSRDVISSLLYRADQRAALLLSLEERNLSTSIKDNRKPYNENEVFPTSLNRLSKNLRSPVLKENITKTLTDGVIENSLLTLKKKCWIQVGDKCLLEEYRATMLWRKIY